MDYLAGLNPQQRAAVENTEGPAMIVAGAGSGKTRVITFRVAHLIEKGVDPFNILVLTFTNKASKDMRERIMKVVGAEAKNIWMGTFHSVFSKILRVEAEKIGYPSNFTIYDTDDSKSLIRTILREMQLDDKLYNANFVYNRISSAKNNLVSYTEYMENAEIQAEDISNKRPLIGVIYETYTKRCFKAGAMDFDDLLFKTNILLKTHPDVLNKYQQKFKYLMVDEYQDTNFSQYTIVKKLAAAYQNICVVGDDAQSIYAFRGANIQNILNFERDYPDLKVYKLEQNYRSTQNIVKVANSIIANNKNQLEKNVFSDNESGDRIKVQRAFTDNEEGKIVADSIVQDRTTKGYNYNDFAILYRTNAQSRAMEEALRKLNIPYKIYGGLSFYQRKEIKDLIAYFRLTFNPADEEAIKRVINYPKRGLGDTTVEKISVAADQHNITMWQVICNPQQYIPGRVANQLNDFAVMIQSFSAEAKKLDAYETALYIAQHSGILKELHADQSEEGRGRHENIQELLNGIKEFGEREDIEDRSLAVFMQDIALLTNDDKKDDKEKDTVSLMTIHSSKGLEFKNVYVVGLEENLFPSQMSLNSRTDLEEERRLFYVAVTRAEKKLTLTYSTSRYRWGTLTNCEPSRFIDEIDARFLEIEVVKPAKSSLGESGFNEERRTWTQQRDTFTKPKPGMSSGPGTATTPAQRPKTTSMLPKAHIPTPGFTPDAANAFQNGMDVEHEKFGFGKIISLEGTLPDVKATVFFQGLGNKQLLLKFAKLRIVK
ncbi:MAG: exodeoxyribonuclease V subunit gamma [Candidatus Pedobacter colombiensis]|uniref:DNA 3'-5' helicase n=1 Tax=Candidatus Pedobacter colombiensis TaxID=3121371 RepID=A0AAJ5W9Q2_9SPHI|nr:UvrD-helicase domain-containing protein [Pedobacter sp.]WEK20617.1 MAG: exodeoxyribonuclease V subunit gamma [Pedobacter sp.]